MTREEEISNLAIELYNLYAKNAVRFRDIVEMAVIWADAHQPSPWITDRMPEIKGSISDAVVLLVDGMFYKVSRLERRKDGTEFWWGVHPEDGDEVDAWMPIPELLKGGKQ